MSHTQEDAPRKDLDSDTSGELDSPATTSRVAESGGYWVYIERSRGRDLMVGPYRTEQLANDACQDASIIDGFCEEDALDCFATADQPDPEDEQVLIEDGHSHYFGRPGISGQLSTGGLKVG